ncbi:MAG: aryl-alcohol dehydrogenase-like predicted oxidoreductase [Gammaproteobacteria bacterium]|jgi:aryl-alcohol dehydrogenase-like predicted oxidoreductase
MEYTRLGRTGLKVSRICLGTMTYGSSKWRDWVLDEDASRPFIRNALEAGINFFDTADKYSEGASEEVLGRALRDFARRDEVVIATKLYMPMGPGHNQRGLSRKHIFEAVDNSLRRLGSDFIDLYQIHRWDYDTPIEETMEALNDVVRAGKVRYIGASSMYAWEFSKALYTSRMNGWASFVSMQNFYNLVYREEEREMLPLCEDAGIGVIPWSPMARGYLVRDPDDATVRAQTDEVTGIFNIGKPSDEPVREAVVRVASRLGIARAQVAIAWLLNKPGVTSPIIGASKAQHLKDALAAIDVTLSTEDVAELEAPYKPQWVAGHGREQLASLQAGSASVR